MDVAPVLAYLKEHEQEHLEILFRLLRQPSISAQNVGVKECAALLCDIMAESGIAAAVIERPGQPVVYGELKGAGSYTLLCYGHYDVQPPDPLDLWQSPPFEPTIRDGKIFCRGVGDNKGQHLAHILAARAWLKVHGKVPVHLKFVVEGEEESASAYFADFVRTYRDRLTSDLVWISDGSYEASGDPQISLGNRGILSIELTAQGADRDNHSGNKGGVVPNPAWTLVHLLSTMMDRSGRVLVEGFYDNIRSLTPLEEEILARSPYNREAIGASMGYPALALDGATYHRKVMLEPTMTINGFHSGYGGKGMKTIIPGQAVVQMDMRLVVDQDPADILAKVQRHVAKHAPEVQVKDHGWMDPCRTRPDHPAIARVARAIERAWGQKPHIKLSGGGSLPNAVWPKILGTDFLVVPYAHAGENNHSPNENIYLEDFFRGIRTSACAFAALAP